MRPAARPRHFPFPAVLLLATVTLFFSGCATTYKVQVSAINNPEIPPATTYWLTTADPNLPDKDLNYHMVADRVRTALAAKGMYEAAKAADADVIIMIDYGARPPRTKVTTVQSTAILTPDPLGREIDPLTGRPYPGSYPGQGNNQIVIGGRGNQYPYPTGRTQTMTTTEERVTVVSEKYIRLTATENVSPRDRGKKKPAQVWIVEAIVEDEKSDVHDVMPPMVNALTDYIGGNSGGKQTVVVQSDEPT